MDLSARISLLATRVANYLRDSVIPRLLPSGGNSGQVLSKSSGTDYAVSWVTHKTVQYSIQIGASGVRLIKPLVVTISDADVVSSSKVEAW